MPGPLKWPPPKKFGQKKVPKKEAEEPPPGCNFLVVCHCDQKWEVIGFYWLRNRVHGGDGGLFFKKMAGYFLKKKCVIPLFLGERFQCVGIFSPVF